MMFVCQRYFISLQEAEDCFIEGFMKMFDALSSYTYINEKSFYVWFRTIMINHCINRLKKQSKENEYLKPRDVETGETNINSEQISVQSVFSSEELLRCIRSLPVNLRTVFNMFAIDGFSYREIAVRTEFSEAVIKTYIYRARKILKETLEQILKERNEKN